MLLAIMDYETYIYILIIYIERENSIDILYIYIYLFYTYIHTYWMFICMCLYHPYLFHRPVVVCMYLGSLVFHSFLFGT